MPEKITRDEVLERFRSQRAIFDAKVAAVPAMKLAVVIPGFSHSVRDIVVHVSAYEALIVARLTAARQGETTEYDRDREGWEAFNTRIWGRTASVDPVQALVEAAEVFDELIDEVSRLTDEELNGSVGVVEDLDPAWLHGRTLAELLAIDGYEHYEMHTALLDAAVQ